MKGLFPTAFCLLQPLRVTGNATPEEWKTLMNSTQCSAREFKWEIHENCEPHPTSLRSNAFHLPKDKLGSSPVSLIPEVLFFTRNCLYKQLPLSVLMAPPPQSFFIFKICRRLAQKGSLISHHWLSTIHVNRNILVLMVSK